MDDEMQAPERALVPIRQQTVDFYGDSLPAGLLADGTVLVPLRPITEALGLSWPAQTRRLRRDEVLAAEVRSVAIMATEGYPREWLALPLDFLPGWLFGLTTSKVRLELQEKITRYRRECFRVLWNAFKGDILPTGPEVTGLTSAQQNLEIIAAMHRLAEQQVALEAQLGQVVTTVQALAFDTQRRLSALEVRLDPKSVLTEEQAAELALAVKTVGKTLERQGDRQGYAKVYSELYRRYRVSSYKNLPQGKLEEVLRWLGEWAGESEQAGG